MTEPIWWDEPQFNDKQVEKLFNEWNALFKGREKELDQKTEQEEK